MIRVGGCNIEQSNWFIIFICGFIVLERLLEVLDSLLEEAMGGFGYDASIDHISGTDVMGVM